MEQKKISVIVTVYNMESLLRRCLESIQKQLYQNLEIIVVDDASTDKSAAVVQELIKEDDRIRLLTHESNKGLFHARITGVEQATGDYIGFVDSDDYVTCDYFSALAEAADRHQADVTVGKIVHEDEMGSRYVHNLYHFYEIPLLKGTEIEQAYWRQEGRCFIWHTIWNKLYTKRIWEQALPHLKKQDRHLIMTEDFAFTSVLFHYAKVLCSTSYGAYFYYQHAKASTSLRGSVEKYKKNIQDLKTAFTFVNDFLTSENFTEEIKELFKNWQNLYLKFWTENILKSSLNPKEKMKLQITLEEALPGSVDEVRDESYFYTTTAFYDNRYNDMITEIASDETKAVSFDVFDTALVRPFYRPSDLFLIMDKAGEDVFGKDVFEKDGEYLHFSDVRMQAESELRDVHVYGARADREDISLAEIYEKIKKEWNIDENTIRQMMEKEIETERMFCKARESVFYLYHTARRCRKKVYFTTDMYLDKETIKDLLEKNGYTEYDGLLVSCEENASKRTGVLYDVLMQRSGCKAENFLHIGDNWDSDVAMAREKGLTAHFYPRAVDCIQFNIPDIRTTHSCCAYTEPTGTMQNYEKAMEFLGTRTALAVAANRLYDNPYISYNEWTEMNSSPHFLGYYALGMHLLGFTKWLIKEAVREGYDTLAFISRDGYLPMEAYKKMRKCYSDTPDVEYLYTSRKAALYGKDFDEETACRYRNQVSAYFEKALFGKAAVVDVGYSGRTQEMLYRFTGKHVDAFYVHVNDGACREREREYGFEVKSFYEYTPSITGGIRELLFSKYAPSCIGYHTDGDMAEPLFELFLYGYCESWFMEQVQSSALRFIDDFCGYFKEYMELMEMRNGDISYPYEFFLSTLREADEHMFDCFLFEDDMWAGRTFSLKKYWSESIAYHKLVPFYERGQLLEAANVNPQWQLYVNAGMEKKNIISKALFWLIVDRKFFKKRWKEHLGKQG